MSEISIKVDGKAQKIASDQRPTHIFAEQKEIVVCRINGELKDLWTDLKDGDSVEGVSISSPDGLNVLRHSTAHVMAQAVQQVFSQTRLGIGPPIKDGFYYDFDTDKPFTPEDLEAARKRHGDGASKSGEPKITMTAIAMKAVAVCLKEFPKFNSSLDPQTNELVLKRYYNLGCAVDTPNGLLVPVIKNADQKSVSQIAAELGDIAARARDNKLKLDELLGGTFTITNGGVFGSLMSTPILNMPQTGILGMHKIQNRPVAIGDKIEIRPMMYLALSYDHRLVDGREAVTFLVRVKENLEDPQRLLLDL